MATNTKDTTSSRHFKHLSEAERNLIHKMLQLGHSRNFIGECIGRNKGTISRELKRGCVTQLDSLLQERQVYFPETAHILYKKRRLACGATLKVAAAIAFLNHTESMIFEHKWSPDAVVGAAKIDPKWQQKILVSTKTLYNYIDKGLLRVKNLDLLNKVRIKKKKHFTRQNKRVLGDSIDLRPKEIEDRQEFGHWEIDTVIGKKSGDEALLTLTERKTRNEYILKIDGKNSHSVSERLQQLISPFGSNASKVFKSITADNGSEFARLAETLQQYGIKIYFAHPYSSWERGSNERHNGLIRRFIPKGVAISGLSDMLIQRVEDWCNHLPRKILDYKTPELCFNEQLSLI